MDEIIIAFFDWLGHMINCFGDFVSDMLKKLLSYILNHPNPQILHYRMAAFMIVFMITTSLISIYINRRRRRLRQNNPRKLSDKKGNTFIINGGNNQIGDNNTQNNWDRQK